MILYIQAMADAYNTLDEDPDIIKEILNDPRTRGFTLSRIYNEYINQPMPQAVLERYDSQGIMHSFRVALAMHRNTPADILYKLAMQNYGYSSEKNSLQRFVADNPNASSELLNELATSPTVVIRKSVAKHKNSTPDLLKKLARDDEAIVRLSVGANPNTPEITLRKLSKDKNWYVRESVAKNRNTPVDILNVLVNDSEEDVRNAAKFTLSYKV